MNLWVDDIRPCPYDCYEHAKSVNEAKNMIISKEASGDPYKIIDMDHDAGDYAKEGGDYIRILDWLEETNRNGYAIRIHSMNPVGVQNMMAIVQKNHWTLVSNLDLKWRKK